MKTTYVTAVALALMIVGTSCEQKPKTDMPQASTEDTLVLKDKDQVSEADAESDDTDMASSDKDYDWKSFKWDLPDVNFPEIKTKDIGVRGDDKSSVYSIGENVLFKTGSAEILPDAKDELQQIASSLKQRYADGKIRVYGFADAVGEKSDNKDLSEERAEAVKDWLVSQVGLDEDNISVRAKGEKDPVASNETAKGRQQNRRVQIVAVNR